MSAAAFLAAEHANRERDGHWWQMFVSSRDARERARWGYAWDAARCARTAVHEYHAMVAIVEQPRLPMPGCSICLSDNCKGNHPCE